jgi:hypothetical protein
VNIGKQTGEPMEIPDPFEEPVYVPEEWETEPVEVPA